MRRNEDPVLQRRRLGDDAEQIAGRDGGALRDARLERPRALAIERRHVDAAREQRAPERVVAVAGEHLERALRAVEDPAEQAGTELDLQRTAGVEHRLADPQPGGVLVDLDRRPVAVEADDLAGERGLADAHDVVQPHALEPARDHDRPGDAPDLARVCRCGSSIRSSCPRLVAERDLVADRLAEHPEQPLPAVFRLVVRQAGRERHHERGAQRVEPPAEGSAERMEVRGVHRDDAVLGVEELLELRLGLRG